MGRDIDVGPLGAGDLTAAAELLATAGRERAGGVARAAEAWAAELGALRQAEPEAVQAAWAAGGRLAGIGAVERAGEAAWMGPLVAWPGGQGAGGALVDALAGVAEGWGAVSLRARFDAADARALALAGGRSFAVVDVAARLVRDALPAPRLDGARGLEIAAPRPADLEAIAELDRRLTGQERVKELGARLAFCARRRGNVVGWLAVSPDRLGPGLALDVSDLGVLVAKALTEGPARLLLSTAAPAAMLAAMALGFRVDGSELIVVRGPAPPARPPQLY